MKSKELEYIKPELMACCGAREIKDRDVVIVGTGFPSIAANISKHIQAPNAILMQESGPIDAQPKRVARSVGDPCLNPNAAMIGGLVEIMGIFLQGGWMDVGFLAGSQVDKYGNINTTVIGDYDNPTSRLPGSGGANPIASLAKKVIITVLHNTRRFTEKVDFITSPGYLQGFESREEAGLPPNTGPEIIVTNKAILKFDKKTKEAYLFSYHPGSTVEEIKECTPWDLKISKDVHETPPPTEEELHVLRTIVDPLRRTHEYLASGYV
jgi:glutaconate CoA-transferase subunit B